MKRLATIIAILSAAASVSTPASAKVWTLDDCISYALENNISVRQRVVDSISAANSVTEARDRVLPTVQAYASESLGFGRGLTSMNTYANRNTQNFSWGASLQLPLFQGLSTVRQIDYSKANLRAVVEQLEATRDDVTLNVIAQYLQALYTTEIAGVAAETVRLSEFELERRRTLLESGKIAELEVLEAESQLAQDRLTLTNAQNERTLALVALCQLLQIRDIDGFETAGLDEQEMPLLSADDVYRSALDHNHSILSSRYNVEAAEKSVKLAQSGYLPTLSFSAGLGSSYYKVTGYDNESFGSQMRQNFNKSLGFSLNIPIFDGFSTRNNVKRARVSQITAKLNLEDTENRLFQTIQQAYYQAVNSARRQQAADTALQASKASFDAVQLKYNYGKANATEFEQAKSAWVKAKAESIQARYEAILRLRILQFYAGNTRR